MTMPVSRVLVIEDDDLFASALEVALERDFEVVLRADLPPMGEIQQLRPSLILLDSIIGPRSGPVFLRSLRQCPGMDNVPVLLMSGNHGLFQEEPDLERLCQGFLHKPFDLLELVGVVRRTISARNDNTCNLP